MEEKQFSECSLSAIKAIAAFLETTEENVKEFSFEEIGDELADALFEDLYSMNGFEELEIPQEAIETLNNNIMLEVSEKVFEIYGKKVLLGFSFLNEDELQTTITLNLGKPKDFKNAEKFMNKMNLPEDTEIIYGWGGADEKNIDMSLEISIVSENVETLYENILSVLNRYSENSGNTELKTFFEMFEDYGK